MHSVKNVLFAHGKEEPIAIVEHYRMVYLFIYLPIYLYVAIYVSVYIYSGLMGTILGCPHKHNQAATPPSTTSYYKFKHFNLLSGWGGGGGGGGGGGANTLNFASVSTT